MKSQLRAIAHLLTMAGLLACAGLTVTACASDPPCPTSPPAKGLAIAVGDRANSARPAWPAQLDPVLTKVADATEKGAPDGVTFVSVDGAPSIGCVMTLNTNANNSGARKSYRAQFMAAVQGEVGLLPATKAQADPLGALGVASAAAGPGGTVLLIDSGLQTVPPLNFSAEDLLDGNLGTIVSELVKGHDLPDLHGQRVILDGIGWTAAPQAPLSTGQRANLVELWKKIVAAAGATSVGVVRAPDTLPASRGLPKVSLVPVRPPSDVALGCGKESILSNTGAVGFLANQTTLRDLSAAKHDLARIARWLVANPTASAKVIGSIAHYGVNDGNAGLSRARAERIRAVLISLGAGPGQVAAAGMGWGPFPSTTAPPNPVSDPLNRRVVVQLHCA